MDEKRLRELAGIPLNEAKKNEFKASVKEIIFLKEDRALILGLAQAAKGGNISSTLNDAARFVLSNKKGDAEDIDFAVDTLTRFFAPIIKQQGKRIQKEIKEEIKLATGK